MNGETRRAILEVVKPEITVSGSAPYVVKIEGVYVERFWLRHRATSLANRLAGLLGSTVREA